MTAMLRTSLGISSTSSENSKQLESAEENIKLPSEDPTFTKTVFPLQKKYLISPRNKGR